MIRLLLATVSSMLLVDAIRVRLDDTAFVFAEHDVHGFLLLRSFKQKKGYHEQIPGGHLDEVNNVKEDAKVTVARELFEETGINTQDKLNRLQELPDIKIGNRTYFYLHLEDSDSNGNWPVKDITTGSTVAFKIKKSDEHTDAFFEKDARKVPTHILKHSGGNNSHAFQKFLDTRACKQFVASNLDAFNKKHTEDEQKCKDDLALFKETMHDSGKDCTTADLKPMQGICDALTKPGPSDTCKQSVASNLDAFNKKHTEDEQKCKDDLALFKETMHNSGKDCTTADLKPMQGICDTLTKPGPGIISIDNKENPSGSNVRLILAITMPIAVLIILATIIGVVLYKRKQKSQLA